MSTFRSPLLVAALLALAATAGAATLKVPSAAHPTIQSAIDAAAEGDVIKVKKDVYVEQLVIDGKSDLTIKGGGSLLSGAPGGTAISIRDSFGVTIIGLHAAGMAGGVSAETVIGLELRSCKFSEMVTGMTLIDCAAVRLTKCKLTDIAEVGIAVGNLSSPEQSLVIIDKCRLTDTGDDAIRLLDVKLLSITRCKIVDFAGDAIGSFGSAMIDTALVEKNVIVISDLDGEGADDAFGIVLRGTDMTVRKNKLVLPPDNIAIHVSGSDVTVQKNKVVGGGTGVQVSGLDSGSVATEVLVLDNSFKGPDTVAIVTAPETLGTVIQGNTANGCNTGLLLWGTAHQVIANTVKQSTWIGIQNQGAVVTFSGNVSTGSEICDFKDFGEDTILDGNLFAEDC